MVTEPKHVGAQVLGYGKYSIQVKHNFKKNSWFDLYISHILILVIIEHNGDETPKNYVRAV